MGLLVDGKWQDKWYDTDKSGGRFEREAARFRNWLMADGGPGQVVHISFLEIFERNVPVVLPDKGVEVGAAFRRGRFAGALDNLANHSLPGIV